MRLAVATPGHSAAQCHGLCAEPLQSEALLRELGIDGVFLSILRESRGITHIEPNEEYNANTLLMAHQASLALAMKLGYATKREKAAPLFVRLLLVLEGLEREMLDILSHFHPRECKGLCGRQGGGWKRFKTSAHGVLTALLKVRALRLTARGDNTLVLATLRDGNVDASVELTPNLWFTQPGLLEVSKRVLELTRLAGYLSLAREPKLTQAVERLSEEWQQHLSSTERAEIDRWGPPAKKSTRRLRISGLIIDGSARHWCSYFNELHRLRTARICKFYVE